MGVLPTISFPRWFRGNDFYNYPCLEIPSRKEVNMPPAESRNSFSSSVISELFCNQSLELRLPSQGTERRGRDATAGFSLQLLCGQPSGPGWGWAWAWGGAAQAHACSQGAESLSLPPERPAATPAAQATLSLPAPVACLGSVSHAQGHLRGTSNLSPPCPWGPRRESPN